MPYGLLHVNFAGLSNEHIVQSSQNSLRAERLSSPDRGDYLLSKRTSFGDMLQGKPENEAK